MPRCNLLVISAVVVFSLLCYQRAERNPYARYLAQVLRIVDRHALEPVPPQKLFDGAMHGITDQLDEYSGFISAQQVRAFESDLEGEFGGIGVMISLTGKDKDKDKKTPVVVNVLHDTPAAKAGVRIRDKILAIDGVSTSKMDMDDTYGLV